MALWTLASGDVGVLAYVMPASETQGQLVGAGKSLNGREKKSGKEKSRRRRRAPGDKLLTDHFQTVGVVLASDWCQETFVIFCPITEQQDLEPFRVFLHDTYIQVSCSPCLLGLICLLPDIFIKSHLIFLGLSYFFYHNIVTTLLQWIRIRPNQSNQSSRCTKLITT